MAWTGHSFCSPLIIGLPMRSMLHCSHFLVIWNWEIPNTWEYLGQKLPQAIQSLLCTWLSSQQHLIILCSLLHPQSFNEDSTISHIWATISAFQKTDIFEEISEFYMRITQGTKGWSAWKGHGANPPGRSHFQTREGEEGAVNMDVWRGNHVWWTRELPVPRGLGGRLLILTLPRFLTLSPIKSL